MFSWLRKPSRPESPPPPPPPRPAPRPGRALVEAALAGTPEALQEQILARRDELLPEADTPPDEAAWREFLADLRKRRWRDAAFAVAEALAGALPGEAWPLLELAQLCGPGADPREMLGVGQRVHRAVPENPAGPRLILTALRALGRGREAAEFFAGLPAGFAGEDWYLVSGIHIAWAGGDGDRVLEYAEKLRVVSPNRSMGFTMASTVHRQRRELGRAEAIIAEALETIPQFSDIWGEAARVAQTADDHPLAFARWAELRRRFPRSPAGYIGAIQLSQRVGKPEQTDALVAEGVRAFPGNRDLLVHAARNAMQAEDADAAARHWQAAIEASPRDAALRVRAAMSLLGTGAERKRRTPATIEALAAINADFPDYVPACIARLKLLRDMGRFEEAEAVGEAWATRFPADTGLATARARIAENRGDLLAAVARIADVRARAPRTGAFEAAYVRALSVAGRHDEADAASGAALRDFPGEIDLLCEHSTVAMRRGDWDEALARAQAALRAHPGQHRLRQMLERARIQAVPSDDAAGEGEAAPAPAELPRADAGSAAFFARFESLGATAAGCEFGIVQRRFGCEPLGLLRWAKIDLEGLLAALANEFEGMGAPENTQLLIRDEGMDHQEYYVEDRRLGYSTHTFVTVEDTSFERMLKQSLRRLVFLRGKLLEDLRAGEKIFVYKLGRKQASEANLRRLHDALRRYADCTLLCVTMEDEAHPKGTLESLRPGLFLGRAGTFMGVRRAGGAGIDTQQWRLFCEQVAAWHDAHRRVAAEPAIA